MDAITLLKTDHDKVKKLLNELETTTERGVKTRSELFATIKGELTVHDGKAIVATFTTTPEAYEGQRDAVLPYLLTLEPV